MRTGKFIRHKVFNESSRKAERDILRQVEDRVQGRIRGYMLSQFTWYGTFQAGVRNHMWDFIWDMESRRGRGLKPDKKRGWLGIL